MNPENFTVLLEKPGVRMIALIVAIREFTSLGLAECRTLIYETPCVIKRDVPLLEAEAFAEKVDALGGEVSLVDSGDDLPEDVADAATCYGVLLESWGSRKIMTIKLVREITGQGLAIAKSLVERAPCIVAEGVSLAQAKTWAKGLNNAGAKASVIDDEDHRLSELAVDGYGVMLKSIGSSKVRVIKEVRGATGLDLRDVKSLVESVPCMVKEGVSLTQARAWVEGLNGAGAEASVINNEDHRLSEVAVGEFGVFLKWTGRSKLRVIKEVRDATGLGLADTKRLVESAPCLVKEGMSRSKAKTLVEALTKVGAEAEIQS